MRRLIQTYDTCLVASTVPPVTVEYARRHIKALTVTDDVMIATWIEAAAQFFRSQTGREITNATYEYWLDEVPSDYGAVQLGGSPYRIQLPHPPLQEVVSVMYTNEDGDSVSFDDGDVPPVALYSVLNPQGTFAERGWVEPKFGQVWPTTQAQSGALRIQYVAGYGSTVEDVPALITGIICYMVEHYSKNRGAVADQSRGSLSKVPLGVQSALDEFRYSALPTKRPRTDLWP